MAVKQPPFGVSINRNHPLAKDLVASYLLNEGGGQKAFNTAINGNNIGVLSNGAVFKQTQNGSAVDFNGTNFSGSKIVIGNPWTDQPTSYTVSCWFIAPSVTTNKYLLNWRNFGNGNLWFQANLNNASKINFTIGDNTVVISCSTNNLSAGVWYNWTGVRSGNNIYSYINGVYQSSNSGSVGNITGVQDCVIGAQSFDYNALWDGQINNVKIWKRALTPSEVMNLYISPNGMYRTVNKINNIFPLFNVFSRIDKIVIDHSKCGTSDSVNFPVLISGTYSYLATVANGGVVQNANGYDICFFSDANLTNRLNWETEKYTSTTGEVVYWVNVPVVSATTDTIVYMASGNLGIVTDQSNKTATWNSGYKEVGHLGNGVTLNANDSTTNVNNGTLGNSPTAIAGKISGGANLVRASNQYISISSNAGLNFGTGVFTASAWVKKASNGIYGGILSKLDGLDSAGWTLNVSSANKFGAYCVKNSVYDEVLTTNTYSSTSDFYYVVFVRDGSFLRLYVNGVADGTIADTLKNVDNTQVVATGPYRSGSLSNMFDGIVDEIRISNVAKSANWILTEYNNQNSPSTFYSISLYTGKLMTGVNTIQGISTLT